MLELATRPISYPRTRFRSGSAVRRDIDELLVELRSQASSGVGLHLGAGGQKIAGLVNCDLHNPEADRKLDAVNLSEFTDGSVDLIEHHHLVEHLSFVDADTALREWSRVLKPGGLLIQTCPDILRVCLLYVKYRVIDLLDSRDKELDYVLRMLVGSQEHAGMFHKSHYDGRLLRKILPSYGFSIEFMYPYPSRPTPSLLTIARKKAE